MSTDTKAAAPKAKTEIKTVTMTDKRVVDFPGKRRLQKEVMVNGDTVSVRLDFVDGETRTCTLPASLLAKAAGHGLSQKLGDEISGVTDLDDAVLAIDELVARITKGEWNETASGGEGVAGASILMRALMEVTGKSKDEIKAFLGTLTPKQKSALREDASIKPVVVKLEAEKAAKAKPKADEPKIDTSSLLAGLASGKTAPANSVFAQAQASQQPQAQAGAVKETERGSPTTQPAAVVGNPASGKGATDAKPQGDEAKKPKTDVASTTKAK